ncbi:MAG TPA: hypothetical protein VKN14_01305 [Flavobacteriaceae bacterium]|nr:hypothetical protein [Flavobacteriaceae bacterium]
MKNIYCLLNGHDLKVTKNVTYYIKEYKCKHCKEKFTTSDTGKIILLTPERKSTNAILENIHLKKIKRKSVLVN